MSKALPSRRRRRKSACPGDTELAARSMLPWRDAQTDPVAVGGALCQGTVSGRGKRRLLEVDLHGQAAGVAVVLRQYAIGDTVSDTLRRVEHSHRVQQVVRGIRSRR